MCERHEVKKRDSLDALREIEDAMWSLINASEVLAERVQHHFEELPTEGSHRIPERSGTLTMYVATEMLGKAEALRKVFNAAWAESRGAA